MHRPATTYPSTVYSTMDEESSPSQRQERRDDGKLFLEILHRLLDTNVGADLDIISWNADGTSFRVHDVCRFEHYLMPVYFGERSAYACCTDTKHKQEPLKDYDSFSGLLQSHGFHRLSVHGIVKHTYKHTEFVRGQKHFALRKNTASSDNTWPMPCLSSNTSSKSLSHFRNARFQSSQGLEKHRPCRASISYLKKSKNKRKTSVERRTIRVPPPLKPIDKRQYSNSLRETLLRRTRTPVVSETYNDQTAEHSIVDLLKDVNFYCDDENASNRGGNRGVDAYEPLCLATSNNTSLDVVQLFGNECYSIPSIDDVEPLDPSSHEEDHSLHEDIADALARI